jgi:hypothetical protein
MRNLVQYPITRAEVIETLTDAYKAAYNPDVYGDIQPGILIDLIAFLESGNNLTQFLLFMRK